MLARRRPDCAVCGAQPTIRTLADSAAAYPESSGRCERLKPRQLRALLERAAAGGPPVTVVDVREPAEFAAGHLAGAVNIPVADLPRRQGQIPRQSSIVFVCRSGVRSQSACQLAAGAGLDGLADLEGGMLAWAAECDPAMQVAPHN